jgi:type IX secretion system PorP/SprF family membrane protein
MKKIITYLLVAVVLFSGTKIAAQQNSLFNTYSMDPLQLNIAYVGATCAEANLHYRTQWIGLKDAPKVFQVNAHTALGQSNAIGLRINSQSMGLLNNLGATFGYAYRFRISENAKVHLGIGVGWSQAAINAQKAVVIETNDVTLSNNNRQTANGFDSEFGAMFIGSKLKAGVSALHLYNSNPSFAGSNGYKALPQINSQISYVFLKDQKVEIEPWLLNRYTITGANIIEGIVNVNFMNAFTVGAGYRSGYGLLALLGAKIGNIKLAYSFDYGATKNATNLGTSHQVMLGFSMCRNARTPKPKNDEPVVADQPTVAPVVAKNEEVKEVPVPEPAIKVEKDTKEEQKTEIVKEESVVKNEVSTNVNDAPETMSTILLEKLNTIATGIIFTSNSYSISAANDKRLREVINVINNRSGKLVVVGYASKEGDRSHNLELAIRRAMVVRQTLINYGVKPEKLSIKNGGVTDNVNRDTEGNRTVRFESGR